MGGVGAGLSDAINFGSGRKGIGSLRADSRDAEDYGRENAERLELQWAEPDTRVAWRAVREIELDVRPELNRAAAGSGKPLDRRTVVQLRRADARLRQLAPRLSSMAAPYAAMLSQEIQKAIEP